MTSHSDFGNTAETTRARWVPVATTKELQRHRKLRVEVDGVGIALFSTAGKFYAFADSCIHQDRSLAKGTLLHGRLICPGHQWRFDLDTGYEEDQDLCQPTYAVRTDDETVYVDVAAHAAGAEFYEESPS